jgi:uncharacterized protein (DUF1778 family)
MATANRVKKKRKNRMLEGARQALAIARGEFEGLVPEPVFHLNARDWAAFKRTLDNPPEPNARLKALMRRKPPWREDGES